MDPEQAERLIVALETIADCLKSIDRDGVAVASAPDRSSPLRAYHRLYVSIDE